MTVEILCRYDAGRQSPVVFLRDTIQGDKIQVWDGQGNPKLMPLDYYRMTAPLSAEDERVLMERFKKATGREDQVVRINHRMPRTSRPLPSMLAAPAAQAQAQAQMKDINPAPAAARGKGNAKPLDAQPLPQGPVGDLPQPGETPAPAVQAAPAPVAQASPAANEPASASIFRKIQELNQRTVELTQTLANLNAEVQKTSIDLETSKAAIKELMGEFEKALDAEAAEELRKRKEMLAALTATVDPLTQAAQAMHEGATKAQEQAQETRTQAPAPKPQAKAQTAPGASGKAPAKGTSSKAAAAKK